MKEVSELDFNPVEFELDMLTYMNMYFDGTSYEQAVEKARREIKDEQADEQQISSQTQTKLNKSENT